MNCWHQIRKARYSSVSLVLKRSYVLQYFPPKVIPKEVELLDLQRTVSLSKIGRSSSSVNEPFDSLPFGPEIHFYLRPIEALLSAGENGQALEKCIGDYTRFLVGLPTTAQQYFFHCAISLFTYVWDFKSAIDIINFMIEKRLHIFPYTLMTLLRRRDCHNPKQIRQLLEVFWSGHVIWDDKAVEKMMLMMLSYNWRAEIIDEFLTNYKIAMKPKVPSRTMISALIQAYATTGNEAQAEQILDVYRNSNEWRPPNNSSTIETGYSALDSLAKNSPCDMASDEIILDSVNRRMKSNVESDASLCLPFTSLLRGYCLSKIPLYPQINSLLSRMDIDRVIPDAPFCNVLLNTYSRWRAYSNALSVYNAMINSPFLPLPDSLTYRKLAILMRVAHEHPVQKPFFFQSPRTLFRHFMLIHSSQVRKTGDSAGIASIETQNALLNTFVRFKDYAGAMLILRLYSDFGLKPTEETRVSVEINLFNRVQKDQAAKELEWRNNFLGKDQGFNYQIQHFRKYARPPRSLSASKEMLWRLHEILGRALLAELGQSIKWARRNEDADTISGDARMQAENIILEAMREMMPSPDLEEENVGANVDLTPHVGITTG